MEITPIAVIHNAFSDKFGIPRQSGRSESIVSEIVFEPDYRAPEALREIEGFDYLWLIFGFSEAAYGKFSPTVRPPRLGGNRRVGVFASRAPYRPNSLGLSSVRLLSAERTEDRGTVLRVGGADLLDGTPIYDIKPYLPFTDSHPDAACGYAGEHRDHRLSVEDPAGCLHALPADLLPTARECLSDDPRPSYIDDPSREFGLRLGAYNITFTVNQHTLTVTGVTPSADGQKKEI